VSKAEELQWQLVSASRDEAVIRRYLEEHPESRFRGLARLNLLRLQKRAQDIETSELTVTDHLTRLLWQKTVDTTADWEQAAAYCGELRLADFEDWRLPTIDELKTLDSIQHYFPKPPFENHWSITAYDKDSAGAWMISTQTQVINVDYKRNTHSIRCVRDLTVPASVEAPAAESDPESR